MVTKVTHVCVCCIMYVCVCVCVCLQVEYAVEGIEWLSVSFVDNQECLDLIAKKPTGLLPLLDEECRYVLTYIHKYCALC